MSKQYLIFTDKACYRAKLVSREMFELAEKGEVGLFDITDPAFPTVYIHTKGAWVSIDEDPARAG